MKKTVVYILSVLAMLATSFAVGMLFNAIFPALKAEYNNTSIYRPWDDPLMYLYFLQPFILTAVLIWVWERVKGLFNGTVGRKALYYSLIYTFIAVIPGMLMTWSSFKVSGVAIFSWTISAFLQVLLPALIFIRAGK